MNLTSIIGKKINQTQGFLEDGRRVPLSIISVGGNVISQVKLSDKEGYNAIQLGFGMNKRPTKPMAGHIKKAGLETTPRFFREARVDDATDAQIGATIAIAEVFEPGDLVDVVGTSKGKGFAGVVKRYHFAGGPKTHGQSDRHRARGSSGSGTTPGRVYPGKKMAGRMGNERVTVKNLEILSVDGDTILVRGLIPGAKGSVVVINKVGKNKKYTPLWAEAKEEVVEEAAVVEEAPVEVTEAVETVATPEETVETAAETVETPEETVVDATEEVKSENQEEVPAEEKAATEEEKVEEEKTEGEQNA